MVAADKDDQTAFEIILRDTLMFLKRSLPNSSHFNSLININNTLLTIILRFMNDQPLISNAELQRIRDQHQKDEGLFKTLAHRAILADQPIDLSLLPQKLPKLVLEAEQQAARNRLEKGFKMVSSSIELRPITFEESDDHLLLSLQILLGWAAAAADPMQATRILNLLKQRCFREFSSEKEQRVQSAALKSKVEFWHSTVSLVLSACRWDPDIAIRNWHTSFSLDPKSKVSWFPPTPETTGLELYLLALIRAPQTDIDQARKVYSDLITVVDKLKQSFSTPDLSFMINSMISDDFNGFFPMSQAFRRLEVLLQQSRMLISNTSKDSVFAAFIALGRLGDALSMFFLSRNTKVIMKSSRYRIFDPIIPWELPIDTDSLLNVQTPLLLNVELKDATVAAFLVECIKQKQYDVAIRIYDRLGAEFGFSFSEPANFNLLFNCIINSAALEAVFQRAQKDKVDTSGLATKTSSLRSLLDLLESQRLKPLSDFNYYLISALIDENNLNHVFDLLLKLGVEYDKEFDQVREEVIAQANEKDRQQIINEIQSRKRSESPTSLLDRTVSILAVAGDEKRVLKALDLAKEKGVEISLVSFFLLGRAKMQRVLRGSDHHHHRHQQIQSKK